LLQVLAAGEWPIPKWIDIHLLHKEVFFFVFLKKRSLYFE